MAKRWMVLFAYLGFVASSPGRDSEVVVRVSTDKRLPYDLKTVGFAILSVSNAVLGRLLKVSENFDLIPDLLEKAYWDYDHDEYVLVLRKDLRFHNGREVTAEDLEFSLVRYFLTEKRADPVAALKAIRGTEVIHPGTRYRPGLIEGIRVTSPNEVRIALKSYSPLFLYRLTDGWLSIVPREELHRDYVTWKRFPIGAGPYRIVSADAKTGRLRARSVDEPGKGAPRFITWTSNPRDPVDVEAFSTHSPPDGLSAEAKTHDFGYAALFFNHRHPLGANVHFRRAIAYLIDRQKLIESEPHVAPLWEMLLPHFSGRLQLEERPSLAKARAELSKVPRRLLQQELVAYDRHARRAPVPFEGLVTRRLQEQLAPLGIRIRYQPSNDLTFSNEDRTGVFRLDNRGSAYADALMTFRPYGNKGFLKDFYPEGSTLEKLLERAELASSRDHCSRALQRLSKRFIEDRYIIPLYRKQNVFWISPRIETVGPQYGVNFDPAEIRIR